MGVFIFSIIAFLSKAKSFSLLISIHPFCLGDLDGWIENLKYKLFQLCFNHK